MSEGVVIALVTGPAVLVVDRLLSWLRNRNKDEAEAGLTIDQRWERYSDAQEERISRLENRVDALETELDTERNRRKGLEAEVDRYKRIAKSLARVVLRLRDELARANGDVPPLPSDVEEAMTIIELP